MFEENLQTIKNSVKCYKRDRDGLMKYYIDKRLSESLVSYFKTLNSSVYALTISDPEKVMKEF